MEKLLFFSLNYDEVQILFFLCFSPVNATIQYLKPCSPLMRTVAALSGFPCLGRHYYRFVIIGLLLFSRLVSLPSLCDEEKENEPAQGGQAVMEHLISCSLWDPLRHRDARGSVILRVC